MSGYTSAFRKALLACSDVGGEEALDKFVRGLKPEVRQWVLMHDPQSFAQAAKYADRVFSGKGKMRAPGPVQSHAPARQELGPTPMELGALDGGSYRGGRGGGGGGYRGGGRGGGAGRGGGGQRTCYHCG